MSQPAPSPLLALARWREVPGRVAALWRRSLQFRTVVITIGLSGLAILVIGLYISFSIASSLFDAQLDRTLTAAANAERAAQNVLDGSNAADRAELQFLLNSVANSTITPNSGGSIELALLRVPGQTSTGEIPPPNLSSGIGNVITEDLRERVQENPGAQFWQSVDLAGSPGVIVGADLEVPRAGRYELYLGYDFSAVEESLGFMQLTGVIGAIALLVLLSAVTLIVLRWIVEPIRSAAATSRRLAAGDLGVRMPSKGEDELATLAASFNGMADTLQARIRELAELSVMQQRFVSDVSHELRTPLTTIRLAGDVLYGQREDFAGPTSRTVELLHTQTVRFESLLADLLEISRYDAGSVDLVREPTNLVHLVGDAVESMHELAREHGVELRLEAPGGYLDADVDPRRIRRIVRNLLGNAIEHGEGKPIVVSVDSNESAVALSVRDYGMGMSEEEVARVFDRFWRADPSRRRTIGGTGLGLAISLEDAAAHGGALEVWSRAGRGTVFRLTLPRRVGDGDLRSPLDLEPSDPDAEGPDDRDTPGGGPVTGSVPTKEAADA